MSSNMSRINDITSRFVIKTTRDAKDTMDLRYGLHWQGPGEPERYVVFLNGRTEWLEKYSYLAEDLQLPAGTAFLTMDHRGQGASGGARCYVDSYDSFTSDAGKVVHEVVGKRPYVLMGHSMGGLISLLATLQGQLRPSALVLASPLLGLPDKPVPRRLAQPLASLLSTVGLGGVSSGVGRFASIPFESNILTHDAELYERMLSSPYREVGATFGWVAATFAATTTVYRPDVLAKLKAPTLVLGGSAEAVVDPRCFQDWVQAASQHASADVQLRLLPGARHELFSEIPVHYRPALAAARDWLLPHLGAAVR